MIRGLDNLWFRLLVRWSVWVDHRAQAHRRRQAVRRLRRELAWQKAHLN